MVSNYQILPNAYPPERERPKSTDREIVDSYVQHEQLMMVTPLRRKEISNDEGRTDPFISKIVPRSGI
jgi:hypothetical protein